ncbi:MAG: hemolysin III family protein [Clostridiales bacterium]|nr:hemolysin III family protein [Clostridia bacterium]MCR4563683.1 hemolysin III family protein [Clostridiales bacterium]
MGYLDKVHLVNYSRKEDWMNSISHMAGGAACFIYFALCIYKAFLLRSFKVGVIGFIYCACMLFMFSCSAVYHGLRPNKGKKVMRMVDHSMIFVAVAGTITPIAVFVMLPIKAWVGWTMLGVAWGAVALGISLTMTLFEKTKALQMVLYMVVGWSMALAGFYIVPVFKANGIMNCAYLIVAGGVVYTLGAILYGIGKKKKYFHFVFHLFIVAASVLHFLAIYMYVFPFKA